MRLFKKIFVLLALATPLPSWAAMVPAYPADDFVESAGICTHLDYYDEPYGTQWPTIQSRLKQLGVRHIRDGGSDPTVLQEFSELASNGIKTIWVSDPGAGVTPTQKFWTPSQSTRWMLTDFIVNNGLTNVFSAVEGLNEIDNYWNRWWISDYTQAGYFYYASNATPANHVTNTYGPPTWWGYYVQDMTSNTWNVMRANPATTNISLIGPAFAYSGYPGNPPTGIDSLTNVNYGNCHPYPFGGNTWAPTNGYATVDNYFWHGQQPSVNIDEYPYELQTYQPAFGNAPMAATETGWFTGDTNMAVSEEAQAKYVPRLYLEYYRLGFRRICLYELLDEGTDLTNWQDNFGLLYNDCSPKPAFTALSNLLGLMADPGPAFNPGALGYSLNITMPPGYTRTNYLRSVVFQKRDGSFWLVLYHEIASSSFYTSNGLAISGTARDIIHPNVIVTANIYAPLQSATLYAPNLTNIPVAIYGAQQTFTLAVNDQPVILKLVPAAQTVTNTNPAWNADFNAAGGASQTYNAMGATATPGTCWNGVSASANSLQTAYLADSTGETSSYACLSASGYAGASTVGPPNPAGTGNALMDNYVYVDTSTTNATGSFALQNVPQGTYKLYVYSSAGNSGHGASVTVNGTTLSTTGNGGGQPNFSGFVQGLNFVVFTNLSPTPSGSIAGTWTAAGPGSVGVINGLQLVQVAASNNAPLYQYAGPITPTNGVSFTLPDLNLAFPDGSSNTMYFRYTLTAYSCAGTMPFYAGMEEYWDTDERVGIGNVYGYAAYSAFNTAVGNLNLNTANPSPGQTWQAVQCGDVTTIIYKIQFNPSGSDTITTWLNPNLKLAEAAQPASLTTTFTGLAKFDNIKLRWGGNGGGWQFSNVQIGTTGPSVGFPDTSVPLVLRLVANANQLTLSWAGYATSLEEANTLNGPWTTSVNQSNPQTITPLNQMHFYRLRQ
jgi:hypothetical protein